jgi:hypothetical protein
VVFVPNVVVGTLAGGATPGTMDGAPGVGQFSNPVGVVIEPSGSVVVADFDSSRLRRVVADGTISTLTAQTGFQRPYAVGWLGGGLYAQTDSNPSGMRGMTGGTIWSVDAVTGVATPVAINVGRPRAFAPLSDGRVVLSDFINTRIRLLDLGTGNLTDLAGLAGCPGYVDGNGVNARFVVPSGVVVLSGNRMIVADHDAHVLRLVTLAGDVSTFAGDGVPGTIDGPIASARFVGPRALALDASGAIYISDDGAHRLRRIAPDGTVATLAGDGTGGYGDGSGYLAEFFGQEGLAVTANGMTLYVADGTNGVSNVPYNRLRVVTIGP